MKIAVLIVLAVLVLPFLFGLVKGILRNTSSAGRKHERAQAIVLLSQIPKGAFGVLLMVFAAHRKQNVAEANQVVESHPAETAALLTSLKRPRDPALSAGAAMDGKNLAVWMTQLNSQGYSSNASAILAFVFHHYLDSPLDEVIQTGGWTPNA
jgi:hypothetical protein